MPLYEYYCPPCGTQFEVLRPMSKMDEAAVCPSGHTTNNRVLSLFAHLPKAGQQIAGPTTTTATSQMACACGGHCSC